MATLHKSDCVILGAGLAGLAAASIIKGRAIVLDRDARPGGLVQSECFSGYWFDRVLHLLYFPDSDTSERVRDLVPDLHPCPPEAWVETAAGTARHPLQMHLNGLEPETIIRCLIDLAEVTFRPPSVLPTDFQQLLRTTFGRALCEVFMLPYNRKIWKRPLDHLAPSGFTWNIPVPDLSTVFRGALAADSGLPAEDCQHWYPRPPAGSSLRGMEVLTRALAKLVPDLRLRHQVQSIDLDTRTVHVLHGRQSHEFRYKQCIATIPLPNLLAICHQTPPELRCSICALSYNRVLTATFNIRGPRPAGKGHWRYYSDESLAFDRLVWMHHFDPLSAPEDGWGLMAEITQPAESPLPHADTLLQSVLDDIRRAGALPDSCQVTDRHLLLADPAYVVFTVENQNIIQRAIAFFEEHEVYPLGRFGRWEYSSMGQVMRDGFSLAGKISACARPQGLLPGQP